LAESLLEPSFLTRLEQLSLVTHRIFTGRMRGERRSKKRGISVEFADYRDYAPGDDLRFVDWNIFGRLDRLFLKLFLEEEDLHLYIGVDSSESMAWGEPRKIDYAVKVAAALGYVALSSQERVSVGAISNGLGEYFPSTRGRHNMWKLFSFLQRLEPDGQTDLFESLRQFSLRNRRKGVFILISDFLDPAGYEGGLRHVIGQGMEVFCLQVLSPEEVRPQLAGDLRLVDIETAATADITVSGPLMRAYQRTVQGFCDALKGFCTERGASYLFTTTEVPFEDLILNYLKVGGLVK